MHGPLTGSPLAGPRSKYSSSLHRAIDTQDFVFAQLIPYIGNKRKLLPLIERALQRTKEKSGVFADLFTGSTVVARFAKRAGWRVLANDWEPYSCEIARGTVALNQPPPFAHFGGMQKAFEALNSLPAIEGYVSRHLCPRDDTNPNPDIERMFFTRENGMRIDTIRNSLHDLEEQAQITRDEKAYVLSALLYSVSYASNTSGVFKGFHRGWGGTTRTALYRILPPLKLQPPPLLDNAKSNLATCEDAQSLAPQLNDRLGEECDVAYIDPPYNQHPYGSNYHVLNTVVLWDCPPVSEQITKGQKSAIRLDWREARRSPYNSPRTAVVALQTLLNSTRARWLIVSYSTDGNIPVSDIARMATENGSVEVFTELYKRYRVSSTRPSEESHNVEFVLLIDTKNQKGTRDPAVVEREIRARRGPSGGTQSQISSS